MAAGASTVRASAGAFDGKRVRVNASVVVMVGPEDSEKLTARLDYASGGAVGALLGFMVGMSVSPVVAPVASGIVAALLGLLGLRSMRATETLEASKERASFLVSSARRVTGFGVACVVAAMIGLHARTHDWFGQSLQERLIVHKLAWLELGYDDDSARDLAAWSAAGAPLSGVKAPLQSMHDGEEPTQPKAEDEPTREATGTTKADEARSDISKPSEGGQAKATAVQPRKDDGVLFTGDAGTVCEELRRYPFASAEAAISRFRAQGGRWSALARQAEKQGPSDAARLKFLNEKLKDECP